MPQRSSPGSRGDRASLLTRVLGIVAAALVLVVAARGCSGSRVTTSLLDGAVLVEPIELPTETCGWYFIAEVHVNGAGPFQMMLDTGMQVTQITPEAADAAGVDGAIRSMRFGDLVIEGHIPRMVASMDDIGRALGRSIDGIVAHDVFGDVLLTYDFPGGVVRAGPGALAAGVPGTAGTGRGPRPLVRTSVGGRAIDVLLDTGSGRGLTLRGIERYALTDGPTPTGARVRLDGVYEVYSGRLANDVQLGPVTLAEPIVHESVSVDLVGQVHLRHFAITFDQRRNLCRFEAQNGSLAAPLESPPIIGVGLAMAPVETGFEVTAIFAGGPAAPSGLRVGDVITAIDGTPVFERGCRARVEAAPPPKSLVMTVERGGEEPFEVEVEQRVLVD